jgi:hypothetical protein
VLEDWSKKSFDEKDYIINKLFHIDSPTPYWTLTIRNKVDFFSLDLEKKPMSKLNAEHVVLRKHSTSLIEFHINGLPIGKMQVKFNNGFLEKAKGRFADITIDDISVKIGSPLSSWNFNLL